MKIIENTLFVLLVLSGLFIIGPQTEAPDLVLPQPEISLSELKDWINTKSRLSTISKRTMHLNWNFMIPYLKNSLQCAVFTWFLCQH